MRRFVSHVVFLSLKENLSSLPNNKLIINENLSDSIGIGLKLSTFTM